MILSGVVSLSVLGSAWAQTATPTPTTGLALDGTTPSGLSSYNPGTPANGTVAATIPTIFGGMAGTCTNPSPTSTCDTCATSTSLEVCNPTSVHPSLTLSIPLKSSTTSTFGGTPRLLWKMSGETDTIHNVENSPSLRANVGFVAEIEWADLCAAVSGGDATCQTNPGTTRTLSVGIDNDNDDDFEEKVDFTFAFRYVDAGKARLTATCLIGVDPSTIDDNQGVCDYTVARGDEKVYITEYEAAHYELPTGESGIDYNRIAMFYVEGGAPNSITSASPRLILDLKSNAPSPPSISDQRITGLQNGIRYCFALGNMDQTGNISYFPVQADFENSVNESKYCATPDQVVGLLDDKSCFIATATFGSPMAPEVQTFRQFRNQILLTSDFGKNLVGFYYKVGPEAAEWISHSEFLRTLSLWMLWPVLLFVKLCLALGFWPAALIALGVLVVLKKSAFQWWQRRSALKGDA